MSTAKVVPRLAFCLGAEFENPMGRGYNRVIQTEKRELRAAALTARRAAHGAVAADRTAEDCAAANFLATIDPAPGTAVSGYWPIGDELDCRPLLHRLVAAGSVVGLPVVVARRAPLAFRAWTPGAAMAAGVLAIPVPAGDAAAVVPSVLIVPLLAFDRSGYRLGYGGGYYDRTLAALRASGGPVLAVGYGFAAQEVAAVPHDDTDQRLDWIVTERQVRRF